MSTAEAIRTLKLIREHLHPFQVPLPIAWPYPPDLADALNVLSFAAISLPTV